MKNTNNRSEKLWIAFGILTIFCGIYSAISSKNILGLSGSVVGVWLVAQNMKQIKNKPSE